jgi:hypothetical protein
MNYNKANAFFMDLVGGTSSSILVKNKLKDENYCGTNGRK